MLLWDHARLVMCELCGNNFDWKRRVTYAAVRTLACGAHTGDFVISLLMEKDLQFACSPYSVWLNRLSFHSLSILVLFIYSLPETPVIVLSGLPLIS